MTRPTADERFWSKVLKTDTCWLWQASRQNGKYPYGQFREGGQGGGRYLLAHRWAYERLVGPIPNGLEIDHVCRNPPCVRPTHLEAVTRSVNVRRGLIGTRVQLLCKRGHLLSEPRSTRDGSKRVCRTCHNERHKRYRRQRRIALGGEPMPTTERRRTWRRARAERLREAGLCLWCKTATNGYTYCEAHRLRLRQRRRQLYTDYTQSGRCVSCGHPAEVGYVRCAPCKKKESGYDQRYYQRTLTADGVDSKHFPGAHLTQRTAHD